MALPVLSDVKEFLNIPAGNTTHDTRLGYYLTGASSQLAQVVGPINATTFTEVHNGGGHTIMLRNPPVLSITSIVEYVGLTPYPLTLQPLGSTTDQYGYSFAPYSGKVTRRDSTGMATVFRGGFESVTVTYTAGVATVDPAVFLAVLEDIRGLYEGQRGSLPAITGQPGDDVFVGGPMTLFPRLEALLQGQQRMPGIA